MATGGKRLAKQISVAIRIVLASALPVWLAGKDAPDGVLLSTTCLGLFLFLMPRSCRATNRDGTLCSNNALGFLGGCHWRKHKWQNAWRFPHDLAASIGST
jgi:hypothetical protein